LVTAHLFITLLHDSSVLKQGKYQHACIVGEFRDVCILIKGFILILYTTQQWFTNRSMKGLLLMILGYDVCLILPHLNREAQVPVQNVLWQVI
jgi:hypothetical protein